jgi:hypothetical protein
MGDGRGEVNFLQGKFFFAGVSRSEDGDDSPRCPLGYPNHEHFRRGIVSDAYHISPTIDTILRPSFFFIIKCCTARVS